jgi:hypothetical protein
MSVITFNADSTSLTLNGTGILDFVEGDFLELNPINPVTAHTNGSEGSVNINKRIDGGVHDLVVRVLKGSDSDVYLNNELEQEAVTIFNGSLKENFVKDGTDGVESYTLENGSITDRPTAVKNNQDGNHSMEYKVRFRNCVRNV